MTDITFGGTSHHAIKDQVLAIAPNARLHQHPAGPEIYALSWWVALDQPDGTCEPLGPAYLTEAYAWEAALVVLQERLWKEALGD